MGSEESLNHVENHPVACPFLFNINGAMGSLKYEDFPVKCALIYKVQCEENDIEKEESFLFT